MRLETKAGEKKRAFCRPASSRYNRSGCQPSLSSSVLETRAACILVTGRLRQAIGFGLITIEDFSLTGQIPILLQPGIRRVVDRGGVGPSRTANMGHHTVKTLSWFAALVRFMVACLRPLYVSHL